MSREPCSLKSSPPMAKRFSPLGQPPALRPAASVTINVPVTEGEVVLLEVSGTTGTTEGDFTLQFTNLDQFQTPSVNTLFFPTGSNPSSLAVADLTGNGKSDLLATNTQSVTRSASCWAMATGLSRHRAIGRRPRPGQRQPAAGGGRPDQQQHSRCPRPELSLGDVSVLLGNGNGTFQPQRRFDAVTDSEALVTGDFNGDGNTDVIMLENFGQSGIDSDSRCCSAAAMARSSLRSFTKPHSPIRLVVGGG